MQSEPSELAPSCCHRLLQFMCMVRTLSDCREGTLHKQLNGGRAWVVAKGMMCRRRHLCTFLCAHTWTCRLCAASQRITYITRRQAANTAGRGPRPGGGEGCGSAAAAHQRAGRRRHLPTGRGVLRRAADVRDGRHHVSLSRTQPPFPAAV